MPAEFQDHKTYQTRHTLLSKVQDQYDETSWGEFIENYRSYIEAIVFRMGIKPEDASDIAQEIFLKLWKLIPNLELDKIKRFRSYLAAVTRTSVCDFVRKETGRRGNRKERFQQYQESLEQITEPAVEKIAEEEWNRYVYTTAFERVSRVLSPKAVAVFKASLEGKKTLEISKELGIGESTAFEMKARVKEALLDEIKAINQYLG